MSKFYLPTHRYSFRCGLPAAIEAVEVVYPDDGEPRMCYRLRWPDGVEDLTPVTDTIDGKPTHLTFSSQDDLIDYLDSNKR